jgi:hypothetical protein
LRKSLAEAAKWQADDQLWQIVIAASDCTLRDLEIANAENCNAVADCWPYDASSWPQFGIRKLQEPVLRATRFGFRAGLEIGVACNAGSYSCLTETAVLKRKL